MKKKLLISALAILVILITWGGILIKKSLIPQIEAAMSAAPTVKVEKGNVEKLVFAKGIIVEAQREEVKAEIKSKVTQVLVKEGDSVKTGDLLFTLYEGASRVALEQEELVYQTKLRDLEKAMAEANTEIIKAPAGGTVVKLLVKEGDKVERDTPVVEVSNPYILEVTAPFGPMGVEKIKAGQKARIFLADMLTYLDAWVTKVDKRGKANKLGGVVHDITVRFTNPGGVAPGNIAIVEALPPGGSNIPSLESAEIKESEVIRVRAGGTGTILKLEVKEGDNVEKNSLLASLDITDSKMAIKDRKLALRQAELARELRQRELGKYRVYASKNGVVSEVNVVEGQEPPMDKPAIVVSNVQGLELRAKVEEGDIPYLRVGQEAVVYANAFGERRFPGMITEIARQGKTEGNSVVFDTRIKIKEFGPLKVGMTGDADIVVERKEGILRLPTTAVIIDGRKGTVMIAGPGGPIPKEVKLGMEGDEFVEIKEGLKVGDAVLMNPNGAQSPMGIK